MYLVKLSTDGVFYAQVDSVRDLSLVLELTEQGYKSVEKRKYDKAVAYCKAVERMDNPPTYQEWLNSNREIIR